MTGETDSVFLELKKKYKGVVYKRRVSLPLREARAHLETGQCPGGHSQILREIDWFIRTNHPQPKALIACGRTALVGRQNRSRGTLFELHYDITLKGSAIPKEFLDELRCRNGNLNIVCGRKNTLVPQL